VGKARMTTMGLAAIFMPSSIVAYYAENFVVCVALISLATACHQAWSANLFTNATDMFPQKVSGSVVGLGATAGGIGGMFMTLLVGLAVEWTGTQQIAFIIAGVMHLIALALFWFWFKAKFVQVNVDAGLDTRAMHKGLVAAAVVVLAVGIWLLSFVSQQWDYIVSIVKFSGALQAAIAAGGFGLIGLALGYAGLPKKVPLAV
jgi:ACS family hexuronate transporter-like MFS transporter